MKNLSKLILAVNIGILAMTQPLSAGDCGKVREFQSKVRSLGFAIRQMISEEKILVRSYRKWKCEDIQSRFSEIFTRETFDLYNEFATKWSYPYNPFFADDLAKNIGLRVVLLPLLPIWTVEILLSENYERERKFKILIGFLTLKNIYKEDGGYIGREVPGDYYYGLYVPKHASSILDGLGYNVNAGQGANGFIQALCEQVNNGQETAEWNQLVNSIANGSLDILKTFVLEKNRDIIGHFCGYSSQDDLGSNPF